MASPLSYGTKTASPFISEYVEILNEKIEITPINGFKLANYEVSYKLKAKKEGGQIPLLFHAYDYYDDFIVTFNGNEVYLQDVSQDYTQLSGTQFHDFSNVFSSNRTNKNQEAPIKFEENNYYFLSTKDLKFFIIDIPKGIHEVTVHYTAEPWVDRSNWVKEYTFRYSLYPAKYWKSFGELEVILNTTAMEDSISSNISKQKIGPGGIKSYTFNSLPTDVLMISYIPEINRTAQQLIAISPFGIAVIIFSVLFVIHLTLIVTHRKRGNDKNFSWIVALGSITMCFIGIYTYVYSFTFIANVIGDEAGRFFGYKFVFWIFYPIILLVYWLIMWSFDNLLRKKPNRNATSDDV